MLPLGTPSRLEGTLFVPNPTPHSEQPSHLIVKYLYCIYMGVNKVPIFFISRRQIIWNTSPDFQPRGTDLDFFNPNYFNLNPIGGVHAINIRDAHIYILFFRSFWKVGVGLISRVLQ